MGTGDDAVVVAEQAGGAYQDLTISRAGGIGISVTSGGLPAFSGVTITNPVGPGAWSTGAIST
ncbi:hypothetical protein GCM10022223_63020 [Kineosporia mesophila]|uniref:Uncharacterized protein n=1 Tax=Kineosporia mesophila TaxID=566012 RepID=A0ABP7AMS5_9ACTN|nr:hypothetical protein [Kineosporia mesophila]MCD5354568.1 hypothetical protein [Kineosporia mesophila]